MCGIGWVPHGMPRSPQEEPVEPVHHSGGVDDTEHLDQTDVEGSLERDPENVPNAPNRDVDTAAAMPGAGKSDRDPDRDEKPTD
jgi:hypothetical protein